jgi:hypothetical protein
MAAHVDGEYVIVVLKAQRDVIEGVATLPIPCSMRKGLLAVVAPVEIVDSRALHLESVLCGAADRFLSAGLILGVKNVGKTSLALPGL